MLVYLLMTTLASFMTFVTLGTGVCRYSLFFSLPKNKIIIVSLFLLQEVSAFSKETQTIIVINMLSRARVNYSSACRQRNLAFYEVFLSRCPKHKIIFVSLFLLSRNKCLFKRRHEL